VRQDLRHLMIAISLAIVSRRSIRQFTVPLLRPVKAGCQRSSGKYGDVSQRSGIPPCMPSLHSPDLDYREGVRSIRRGKGKACGGLISCGSAARLIIQRKEVPHMKKFAVREVETLKTTAALYDGCASV
jgi:hypothetical protein